VLSEMYSALDNDLSVVSAIAARTVFDRALAGLRSKGKIRSDEEDTLRVLVNAGSAAAHRDWRPKPEKLNTMIEVVESWSLSFIGP